MESVSTSGFIFNGPQQQSPAAGTITGGENGVSRSTTDLTKLVLGNNVGDVLAPAQFLNDREIRTANFALNFVNVGMSMSTRITGTGLRVEALGAPLTFTDIVSGRISIKSNIDIFYRGEDFTTGTLGDFYTNGVGCGLRANSVPRSVFLFAATGNLKVGASPTLVAEDNAAKLQVDGSATYQRFISAQTVAYNVSATEDNNKVFTNQGAGASVAFSLPGAAAGRTYVFAVQDVDGLSIIAAAGDTIRFGVNVTAAGGTVSSITIGSTVRLTALNTTEWFAEYFEGLWTV